MSAGAASAASAAGGEWRRGDVDGGVRPERMDWGSRRLPKARLSSGGDGPETPGTA